MFKTSDSADLHIKNWFKSSKLTEEQKDDKLFQLLEENAECWWDLENADSDMSTLDILESGAALQQAAGDEGIVKVTHPNTYMTFFLIGSPSEVGKLIGKLLDNQKD